MAEPYPADLHKSGANRYSSGGIDAINLESYEKQDYWKEIKKKFHLRSILPVARVDGLIIASTPEASTPEKSDEFSMEFERAQLFVSARRNWQSALRPI
jgi:hypothetical protein